MLSIKTISASTSNFSMQLVDGMHRLRHEVFVERLGWDVTAVGGREIDEFDKLEPTYMIAHRPNNAVEAGWRLLPTSGRYMLKDVFPELLDGECAPENESVWEISRWASTANLNDKTAQAYASEATLRLIREAYDFALANSIKHYIVVTSVSMERLVKRIGLPIRRFGNQNATRIGKVLSVACWVDVDEKFRDVVYSVQAA